MRKQLTSLGFRTDSYVNMGAAVDQVGFDSVSIQALHALCLFSSYKLNFPRNSRSYWVSYNCVLVTDSQNVQDEYSGLFFNQMQ